MFYEQKSTSDDSQENSNIDNNIHAATNDSIRVVGGWYQGQTGVVRRVTSKFYNANNKQLGI